MNKLRYDEGGAIWQKSMELVKNGIAPDLIDANMSYSWRYWFYFESYKIKELAKVGGDKTKINNNLPASVKKPKYRIYTKRTINYNKIDITKLRYKRINGQSFLSYFTIYIINNE